MWGKDGAWTIKRRPSLADSNGIVGETIKVLYQAERGAGIGCYLL